MMLKVLDPSERIFLQVVGKWLIALAGLLTAAAPCLGWDRGTVAYEGGDRAVVEPLMPADSTNLLPASGDGPVLRLRITNLSHASISQAAFYAGITDFTGKGLWDEQSRVDLPAEGSVELALKVESLRDKPGFYDVRTELFDHGRELTRGEFSFGYDVEHLPVNPAPPADFDRFWKATRDTLEAIPLNLSAQRDSLRSDRTVDVYRVSYSSIHGVRVYGWYTAPRGRGPYAALIFFPGYSSGRIGPSSGYSRQGYATLSIQVRGYEVDQSSYPEDNSQYMCIGIESPESYVFREIICHCLRGLDFLASRPEVDTSRIGAIGGSQGGGLALFTAGLDKRVKAVDASVPFLTDFPRSMTMTGNPYREVVRYIQSHPESRDRVMRTVSYVDVLNLADRIRVPVLVAAGLFDRTCPAPSIYGMYLALGSSDKRISIYPYLDHLEVSGRHGKTRQAWLLEHLPPVKEGN